MQSATSTRRPWEADEFTLRASHGTVRDMESHFNKLVDRLNARIDKLIAKPTKGAADYRQLDNLRAERDTFQSYTHILWETTADPITVIAVAELKAYRMDASETAALIASAHGRALHDNAALDSERAFVATLKAEAARTIATSDALYEAALRHDAFLHGAFLSTANGEYHVRMTEDDSSVISVTRWDVESGQGPEAVMCAVRDLRRVSEPSSTDAIALLVGHDTEAFSSTILVDFDLAPVNIARVRRELLRAIGECDRS
jgi:hypothetical protein